MKRPDSRRAVASFSTPATRISTALRKALISPAHKHQQGPNQPLRTP
jgi:hypothetical protein